MADKALYVIRWIVLLPGAFLAAWAAWLIVSILERLGLSYAFVDPESFMAKAYLVAAGHAAMGAAFVYTAARIAPAHRKSVAYIFAALGFVTLGFSLFPAVYVGDLWAMLGAFCTILGIGAATYLIHSGEIDVA